MTAFPHATLSASTPITSFPLEQWFNLSQPITREQRRQAEAQMALYAIKDGVGPEGKEVRREYEALRNAVAKHNAALRE